MAAALPFPTGKYLGALAGSLSETYRGAAPFPHIVVDDFLPEATAQAILDEFPGPGEIAWGARYADTQQLKLACEDEEDMGPMTRQAIGFLNSGPFLRFLETLTGIEGLIADPYLKGGGLHQIRPGGFLKLHADFNWYERLKLDRRLNLLLYLNRDWLEDYGGYLELWPGDMARCTQRIAPAFNRCVVFTTTDQSYHGHPDPLRCPPDRTRKSLALYYYTNGRPETERSAPHPTLFKARPNEKPDVGAAVSAALRSERRKRMIENIVPPICWAAAAAIKRGLKRGRTHR